MANVTFLANVTASIRLLFGIIVKGLEGEEFMDGKKIFDDWRL
ncbi:MAG TPA: hypothetical protein VKA95_06590 [Nitrososphaeraceae archaeon]|nr:hypothetical protein [Nitrososphaeraceae archaeon]